jgi:N-[(2S)-2-amino-2-carboxyethyl]-L-glutamate dehydrogenase
MIYLSEKDLLGLGKNWSELADVIENATMIMNEHDYAQPVKPYLRYRDMANRIIAMPAFVGGKVGMAGIKWIASFPANIDSGLNRAHSVTILNEASTGRPLSIINTTMVSAIRTAAVSAFFIRSVTGGRTPGKKYNIGISGFGIIGRTHLEMIRCVLGPQLGDIFVFDIRPHAVCDIAGGKRGEIIVTESWQHAYAQADIFITCTVSRERYIDIPPKNGSLQLNVSLRDYKPCLRQNMDYIFVDNWEEVCRENTDVEKMHQEQGLQKEDTLSITELLPASHPKCGSPWADEDAVVMFNPMGMAVYDIAIGAYYYNQAVSAEAGITLP